MGIGEALAKIFAEQGASVVLSARDLARLEGARARIGHPERTAVCACDVSRSAGIHRLLEFTLERFGRVDVWINNAGYGLLDSIARASLEECRKLFDTNLFGAIECLQAVVPVMKKQGAGTVINISSVAGHISVPYSGIYSASKHALNAVGRAARMELQGSGVNVLTVCPGYVATDFAVNAVKGNERKRLGAAARRGISAERVARAVLRGYLAGKREIVVPWKDHLAIKLYQVAPRLIERIMTGMLRPAEQVIAEAQAARK
ncbi:MAG: SDR family NAD(P)-dependent oxidoreductase, partial [Terriglobales bacterium]